MASFHHRIKSGPKGSAAEHARYISREGKYSDREDLIGKGYGNMPQWAAHDPGAFWKAGDKFERANGAVYREHEIALPVELTPVQQRELVDKLVAEMVPGKPYQFAIHAPKGALSSVQNPHLHLMYSDRASDGIERSPEQVFARYNATYPERGGRKKDSGGRNRLAMRDQAIEARRKCADLQNDALERYGHTVRVDHRSYRDQGIQRQAEHHLGQARIKKMSAAEKEAYLLNREKTI